MLGIDRTVARYVWTAAVIVLLLCLVFMVRKTLFIFILALLFAYLISPLVNLLDRVLPASRTRTPALALAYIIFVAAVVVLVGQIGSRVVSEGKDLGKRFPDMLSGLERPSPEVSPAMNSLKAQVIEKIRSEIAVRSTELLAGFTKAGVEFLTLASNLIYVFIIPILSFFFLKDAQPIREHLLDMVDPGPRRVLLDDLLADIHLLLAHYMRALVVLSLAAFTTYSVFFSVMGVPYAILLAALGGLLEFIPMIGPLTAGIAITVVSFVSGAHVVAVIIFLLAYRVFQDYILSPHLMGQGVEVHPLLVLFGVFAGAELAGIPGTFLSVPTLALARVLYLRIRKLRLGSPEKPTPTPTLFT
jgi:predicted PurR-regulated permease PerM